jgi:hypothetical protein
MVVPAPKAQLLPPHELVNDPMRSPGSQRSPKAHQPQPVMRTHALQLVPLHAEGLVMHRPLSHTCEGAQGRPQPPQWAACVWVLTHTPSQRVSPVLHAATHTPP